MTKNVAFPSDGVQNPKLEPSNCLASLAAQMITSLVVGIVVGAGAAIAAYFLTHHVILWTAVAGGGSFVLVGAMTFVVLRCFFVQSEPEGTGSPVPVGTITLDEEKPKTAKIIERTYTLEKLDGSTSYQVIPSPDTGTPSPKVETPAKTKTPSPVVTSNAAVCLTGFPYKCKKIVAVDQNSLPTLILTVDAEFPKKMAISGIVYYDPTNELPIPLPRLYQEMLMHPACGDKRDVLIKLLAEKLLNIFIRENGSYGFVHKWLYSFDVETVVAIGKQIPTSDLKSAQLQTELVNYAKSKLAAHAIWSRSEIGTSLTKELGKDKFYLGSAEDNGACLFHTMAQLLSLHTGQLVTEKNLRMQCAEHLRKEGGYAEDELQELSTSSRDLVEKGQHTKSTVSWGDITLAEIIAENYDVEFKIYAAEVDRVTKREAYWELNEQTGEEEEIPAIYEDVKTFEISEAKPSARTARTAVLRIALMKSHFFPIWTQ